MKAGLSIRRPLQALAGPHANLRRHGSCTVCCQARRNKSSAAGTVAPEVQHAAPPQAAAAQPAPAAAARQPPEADQLLPGAAAPQAPDADDLQDGEGGDFHAFFGQQWGPRWRRLFAALAAPTRHVALHNAFLRRPPAVGDLPGGAPLQAGAGRHAALAAALQAASAAACGAADGDDSGCGSSEAPAVQALQWELQEPSSPAAAAGYPPPPADAASGLSTHYWLDPASLLPPLLLGVRPGQRVLDMCAAPGGKSLVLAQLLFAEQHEAAAAAAGGAGDAASDPEGSGSDRSQASGGRQAAADRDAEAGDGYSGQLVCNELDTGRRGRLLRVLKAYVPADVRQHMRVTPHDAALWWGRQEAESFDRVLLDAPCSSDRHVVQQAAERGAAAVPRAAWSAQRCRRIARDQARLLAAGVKALRPGGRLVYSTCSIAELENDGVIDRVLDKAGGSLAVISHTLQPPCASGLSGSAGGGSTAGSSGAAADGGPAAAAALAAALAGMGAERTRHGWLLLPDATSPPCGPIYLAVLHKAASSDLRRVKVNKYARQSRAGGGGSASSADGTDSSGPA